jgi:hypothetical protein
MGGKRTPAMLEHLVVAFVAFALGWTLRSLFDKE